MAHVLADGTPLVLGMRVKEYNCKFGVVIDDELNRKEFAKEHCGNAFHACNSWFYVQCDDGSKTSMDCSRMIAEKK